MASRRSQILDAAFNALSASTATDLATSTTYTKPAATIYRTRIAALKAADLPAIVLRAAQEDTTRQASVARRSFAFAVHCFVGTASAGTTVESALDALTSWVVQAVSNAATLQGGRGMLCESTHEVLTKWEETDSDEVYGRATIGFLSDYITAAGNPDAAP